MTTTSWHKLFGLGASVALVAVACTVSSGSDDDDDGVTTGIGGSGGSDAGGSGGTDATGGTDASGGSAGDPSTTTTTTTTTSTTGSGGSGGSPEMVECLMEDDGAIPGTPASCDIDEENDPCCTRCVKTNCCDGYGDCFASEPNICGGSTDENSEIMAFINCMLAIEDGATPGMDDGSDLETCMAQAIEEVSWICDAAAPSGPTNELATCMHGDMDGLGGCFFECLDSNFEEDECVY